MSPGKTLNVYTDSQYAYTVCHIHGIIWKQRGFLRAGGTPVTHGKAISALLEAIHYPKALAIIKCAAHQTTNTLTAKGNNSADEATSTCMEPIVLVGDCEPFTTLTSLIAAQAAAGP